MLRNTVLATAVAIAMLPAAAAAQESSAKLFAKEPEYQQATLSPNGAYVAVTTPFEDRRALSLIKLSGNYDRSVIKFDIGPDRWGNIVIPQPENPYWVADNRIVVSKAMDFGRYGSLVSTGDIYAADADGTNQVQLFGYLPDRGNVRSRMKDEGSPYFSGLVGGRKGEVMYTFIPWGQGNSQRITTVYRVNAMNGDRRQVEKFEDVGYFDVSADQSGAPRIASMRDLDAMQQIRYRPTAGAAWTNAPESLVGSNFELISFDADNDHAIARISDKGEPGALYRVSLSTGTREKLVSHPLLEPTGFQEGGFDGNPIVVSYNAGKPKIEYLDPKSEYAQLHAGLMKAFPGQLVKFIDFTRDNRKLLFFVHSDRHPGAYYLLDRDTNTPTMLFETRSWIDPQKMSPVAPLEFKNRSGVTLHAFLTLPQGRQGPHPVIVMPHGGPYGIYDEWTFDNDAQFFASLGYAVLQVNYRGSGGRGDGFENVAYKQWGTGIQDDIYDALQYAVSQKLADPAKACIFGISFGGYSAMMNPIRYPGTYKCSIAYAGVYDLKAHYSQRDGSKQGRAFWTMTMGDEANQVAQSPLTQIAKLDAPILLIHGRSDSVAPFDQFNYAQAALSHAGKPYETLVKPNEGHGFYKEANRVEAYERMAAFLAKYNPVK